MSECILWSKRVNNRGYGLTKRNGKTVTAHRDAFFKAHGYLPPVVMHSCDVKRCINPDHLLAGTQSLNMKDCKAKGRWKSPLNLPGVAHRWNKLDAATMLKVHAMRASMSVRAIARVLGVDESSIRKKLADAAGSSSKTCGTAGAVSAFS